MITNKEEFYANRRGFGYVEEQIDAEWLVLSLSPQPFNSLPSSTRDSYVSEEAWLHGLSEHERISREINDAKNN